MYSRMLHCPPPFLDTGAAQQSQTSSFPLVARAVQRSSLKTVHASEAAILSHRLVESLRSCRSSCLLRVLSSCTAVQRHVGPRACVA
eukprot:1028055-Pleurochrysis_carterae.AAC.5